MLNKEVLKWGFWNAHLSCKVLNFLRILKNFRTSENYLRGYLKEFFDRQLWQNFLKIILRPRKDLSMALWSEVGETTFLKVEAYQKTFYGLVVFSTKDLKLAFLIFSPLASVGLLFDATCSGLKKKKIILFTREKLVRTWPPLAKNLKSQFRKNLENRQDLNILLESRRGILHPSENSFWFQKTSSPFTEDSKPQTFSW